jgi:hypothetical protein
MKDKRQIIPAAGLLATLAVAIYMVVQLSAQTATPAGDFTNAGQAEVRDAQGQVLLRGSFEQADEDDDDIERKAVLAAAGADPNLRGEAEVEFSRNAPAKQEIEFSVRNVAPGTVLTFAIDGVDVATATADGKGRAEVEVDVPMPGTAASQ